MPHSALAHPEVHVTSEGGRAERYLGRFQLLRLLGKSARSTIWLVAERSSGIERMLVIPRQRPTGPDELSRWLASAQRASRLDHPGLAPVVEVGEQEGVPFIAYERQGSLLLTERLGRQGVPPADLVTGALKAIEGLAAVHEAGWVHGDLHAGMWQMLDSGGCRLMGLGALLAAADASGSLAQRRAAERDVLAVGLVLHHALVGTPALDEPDVMQATTRLAPLGREAVRLPRTEMQPVAEPLRAIVNRATDRQERQRYRSARTLARALAGWLQASSDPSGGPIGLLLDRLRVVGLLPTMPGTVQQARRVSNFQRERNDEIAEQLLTDVSLSLELLRAANVANRRAGAVAGNGPIMTVRRAIALLGLDAVRRAAQVLKPWPGPLNEMQAADLQHQLDMAHHAGRVAQWVRPAGYDAELVYLLAVLQRLGRLVAQYHFPDEAAQIRRLMQPAPPAHVGDPEEPGMSETGAAYAVLGADLDSLGQAVARHWGWDDAMLHMMRRLPLDVAVHPADSDLDLLRQTASCANEVVDAQGGPAGRRQAALHHVTQRFARALHVRFSDIQAGALDIPPDQREPAHSGFATRPAAL